MPESIHPLLTDSLFHVSERPAAGAHGVTTEITFHTPLSGSDLAAAIAEPLTPLVEPGVRTQDVITGVKAFTYPTGRTMRHLRFIDSAARRVALRETDQITALVSAITKPDHSESTAAKVHVYSQPLAEMAVWMAVEDMKPTQVIELCHKYGVSADELRIWRAKGGSKNNNHAGMYDLGLSDGPFTSHYLADKFALRNTRPGDVDALIPYSDLPGTERLFPSAFVQLTKEIEATEEHMLARRYQARLWRDNAARHEVLPKLAWRTEHGQEYLDSVAKRYKNPAAFVGPQQRLVFDYEPPEYDLATNTVRHTSTLLGAILLARQLSPDSFQPAVRALRFGKRERMPGLAPRKLAAALVGLVHLPAVNYRLQQTDGFKQIELLAAEVNS